MNLTEKYISEYTKNFTFDFSEHISCRIFDVEIGIDVFEYNDYHNHREKAHVIFQKGELKYECILCDNHHYENSFYPVILNGQHFICFRKTLYGFTLINADTLFTEYEYFPAVVMQGEESFIITDVKQSTDLLIFEGCYWACPYECFVFDYVRKLFWNVSKAYGIVCLDKTILQKGNLILSGTDENNMAKEIAIPEKALILGIEENGKSDF